MDPGISLGMVTWQDLALAYWQPAKEIPRNLIEVEIASFTMAILTSIRKFLFPALTTLGVSTHTFRDTS